MKIYAVALSVLATMLFTTESFSQAPNKVQFQLGYNISAPLNSFKNDYISNTSFNGVTGQLTYAISPAFSLGLQSGYQDYYQKYGRAIYHTQGNEVVSAVISNSMLVVPLLVNGTYSPMGKKPAIIQPYVSAGAGVSMVSYKQYLGEFPTSSNSAAFTASAGAGILVPFNRNNSNTGFKLGASYNYAAYNKNGLSNLNTIGANAGVVFNLK